MAQTSPREDSVGRKVFWPIYMAGRFILGMLFLSMFAVAVAIYCYKSERHFTLDGVSQQVSPEYMLAINERSIEHAANAWLSEQTARALYTLYFKWTGIHGLVLKQSQQALFGRVVEQNPNEVAVAMLAVRLFGIRTGNVILSLPLILLVLFLATVDGLAERQIRRECGGHESGMRFRMAKKFAFALLPPAIALVYLCLPLDISLGAAMMPALAVMAILFRTKMKYYKKYI